MSEISIGDLRGFREQAESVLERLQHAPEHPELIGLRADIQSLAQAIIEQSDYRVTIGLFGEFSVGKSLILGTLLGNPLLLPVYNQPATCNVSVLELHQCSDGTARIVEGRIDYFETADLDAYITKLIDEAGRRGRQLGLAEQVLGELSSLPPGPESVEALSSWIVKHAPARTTLLTLREEVEARASALAAEPPPGPSEPIGPDQLPLVVSRDSAMSRRELPDPHGLRIRRPLIRRVWLDVAVPVWAWNLSEMRGAQVLLIDLPGRQGGDAAVRDEYLGGRELADITTGLIVLNADRSAATGPLSLVDLMFAHRRSHAQLQDRVLVAAGRFDGVQGLPEDQLLDDAGQSLLHQPPEEEELLAGSADLTAIVKAARSLLPPGGDDRIAFVSPFIAIARAKQEGEARWDREQVMNMLGFRSSILQAGEKADDWRKVGFPDTEIGAALTELAADGGMKRLSKMITRHVTEHGLELVVDDVGGRAAELGRRLKEFEEQSAELGAWDAPDFQEEVRIREAIQVLDDTLSDLQGRVWIELGDPHHHGEPGKPSLHQRVEQDAAHLIFGWPQWRLLLGAVQNGVIVVRSSTRDEDEEDEDWWGEEDAPPVVAGNFLEPFQRACQELQSRARDQVTRMVDEWLRDWQSTSAEPREILREALNDEVRLAAKEAGRATASVVGAIDRALTGDYLSGRVQVGVDKVAPPSTEDITQAFPFDPVRAFAWHPESGRRGLPEYCHAIQVPRLRRELVAAATAHVSGYLSDLQQHACDELSRGMERIQQQLAKNADQLVGIVTGSGGRPTPGEADEEGGDT